MRRGLTAVSCAVAVAAASAGCGVRPAHVATSNVPVAGPTASPAGTPISALRDLKRREHARYMAGPARGPAGVFAALSFISSVYCCRNPHNRLVLLRWDGHSWQEDGRLNAIRDGHNWDFPYSYAAGPHLVAGASTEAPVFLGPVNGTYPNVEMAAVRGHGRWRWARFIGCDVLTGCRGKPELSPLVANSSFRGDHLFGSVPTCKPDCASSRVTYEESWAWSTDKQAFVLARVKPVRHGRTE